MFTSSLPLQITPQQVTTVFQNITDLVNSGDIASEDEIPKDIIEILDKFHSAHKSFIKKIDKYMHKQKQRRTAVKNNVSIEKKIVKSIIETCPQFLSSENKDGEYPIHVVSKDKHSSLTYLPMFVEVGSKNGIGSRGEAFSEGSCGGLMTFRNGCSPFVRIIQDGDIMTIKALADLDSKIIDLKALVAKTGAIHLAVNANNSVEMTKYLVDLSPDGLYNSKLSKQNFPIHGSKSFYTFKHLLKKGIEYKPDHETVGGLFHQDIYSLSAIDSAIKTLGNKMRVYGCITQVLARHSHNHGDVPILHHAIKLAPKHAEDIILYHPHSCFILDQIGRLPVHVALANGMKWSNPLIAMINSSMQHLGEVDPVTKFCPSALAAMEPSCDLDTIYHLLRMHPKHVEIGISKVRKLSLSSSSCEDNSERRLKRLKI